MQIITLRPLSQGELSGSRESFIDWLFSGSKPPVPLSDSDPCTLSERVHRGGYPEALTRKGARRASWFSSYLTSILQRDIREISNIEGLMSAPRLLTLLAARSASLLNVSELSRSAGIPHTTLQRYLSLFEATFLTHTVRAWSVNAGKRLVKAPKILMGDTGFMANLLNIDATHVLNDIQLAGRFMETFVGCELLKQMEWSRGQPALFHYRTSGGAEVDYVLEEGGRRIAGVEVKLSKTIKKNDVRGLECLAHDAGDGFVAGVVLYTGEQIVPFGKHIWALPVRALWELAYTG